MSTNTYVALDKITVGSAVASVTFSSIPSGYTDLVLVSNIQTSANASAFLAPNSLTYADISGTYMYGNGTAAGSGRLINSNTYSGLVNNFDQGVPSSGSFALLVSNIQNYSNNTTYKTCITRYGNAGGETGATVSLWKTTSPINTLIISAWNSNTFNTGCTFSLYGIAAAGASPAAKATGGAIYADDLYYYHVFGSTGTFTPLQSISADVLVVAGGGGGGATNGAGGGAGGVFYATAQSLTATGYTATVGAGGTGGTAASDSVGTSGTNSTFAALTAAVGGGYGAKNANAANGGSGGGGNNSTYSAGTSTQTSTGGTGYGNSGGTGATSASGGGGGSGAAGSASGANDSGGAGGVGTTAFSSWVSATGIGQLVSSTGYIAGGGGGGADARTSGSTVGAGGFGGGGSGSGGAVGNVTGNGVAGTTNSGGGGGGGGWTTGTVSGGAGGSGVVIVRYLKA